MAERPALPKSCPICKGEYPARGLHPHMLAAHGLAAATAWRDENRKIQVATDAMAQSIKSEPTALVLGAPGLVGSGGQVQPALPEVTSLVDRALTLTRTRRELESLRGQPGFFEVLAGPTCADLALKEVGKSEKILKADFTKAKLGVPAGVVAGPAPDEVRVKMTDALKDELKADLRDELKADKLKADKLKADKLKADKLEADELEADALEADELEADKLGGKPGWTNNEKALVALAGAGLLIAASPKLREILSVLFGTLSKHFPAGEASAASAAVFTTGAATGDPYETERAAANQAAALASRSSVADMFKDG